MKEGTLGSMGAFTGSCSLDSPQPLGYVLVMKSTGRKSHTHTQGVGEGEGEGEEVIAALWTGMIFSYRCGRHYLLVCS